MITNLRIQNYKSVYDETIELGRFNVFIGENGSGKTNILEAVAMASAAAENKLSNDELALKGIRVAKPSITFSSFLGEKSSNSIEIQTKEKIGNKFRTYHFSLKSESPDNIFSKWLLNPKLYAKKNTEFSKDKFLWVQRQIEELQKNELNKKHLTEKEAMSIEVTLKFLRETSNDMNAFIFKNSLLKPFQIFNLSTQTLRGIGGISREIPGIQGENLDRLIESFDKEERQKLEEYAYFISWLDKIEIDKDDSHKSNGHKLDMSTSILYFRDRFMQRKNNLFSAENANEGVLHILFYLALFISKHTSKFFAIDNIETALNPELCKKLIEQLVKLTKETDRKVLITTHSPAVLDGLNLHDDEQRLFKVYRNNKGHTKVKRIQLKPDQSLNGQGLKLSEMWMRNYLGAIPQNL